MKKTSIIIAFIFSLSLVCCGQAKKECTEHDYLFISTKNPTCVENGIQSHYECTNCGKFFNFQKNEVTLDEITIPKLGHDFSNKKEDEKYIKYQAPDCTTKSEYYFSCIRCDASSKGTDDEHTFFSDKLHHLYVKHEKKRPTDTDKGHGEYYTCESCDRLFVLNNNEYKEVSEIPEYYENFLLKKYNGAEVDLLSSYVRDYLNVEDNPSTENNEIAEWLYKNKGYMPSSNIDNVKFEWDCVSDVKQPYTVLLSTSPSFESIAYSLTTNNNEVTLSHIIPDTYYWKVVDADNKSSMSDSFTIAGSVRPINVNGVLNFRDLGGWSASTGMVKYGKVYRCAGISGISTSGINTIKDELKIVNEVDIRIGYPTPQVPIPGVDFVNFGVTDNYYQMYTDETTIENLEKLVNFLARPSSYPLMFHCSAGCDRTGYVALIIESILGVSDEDIFRDYELTSFYFTNKRFRANALKLSDNIYGFDPTGLFDCGTWNAGFAMLTSNFLKAFPTQDKTISSSVKSFLMSKCNITQETLDKIVGLLTE